MLQLLVQSRRYGAEETRGAEQRKRGAEQRKRGAEQRKWGVEHRKRGVRSTGKRGYGAKELYFEATVQLYVSGG